MATHVVEDGVLGKISRKMWELTRMVLEGKAQPHRVMFYLQNALEGVPVPTSLSYQYLFEVTWEGKQVNTDRFTVTLETHGQSGSDFLVFEALTNRHLDAKVRKQLFDQIDSLLRDHHPATMKRRGTVRISRVNKVSGGVEGHEVCFSLRPLLEIGESGTVKVLAQR